MGHSARQELRFLHDQDEDLEIEEPRAHRPTPGKVNRSHRIYASAPAPVETAPLDWGAALLAPRGPAESGPETSPPPGAGYGISQVEGDLAMAAQLVGQCQRLLVPAFQRAVGAVDPAGATQLAQALVAGVSTAQDRMRRAGMGLAGADPHARLVSHPGQTAESPEPDAGEVTDYQRVRQEVASRQQRQPAEIEAIVAQCSVARFGGAPVPGLEDAKPPVGRDPVAALIRETSIVIDVLATASGVHGLMMTTRPLTWEVMEQARAAIRMWRSRPATFQFLRHVLIERGWWWPLAQGSDLEGVAVDVREQARHTGAFGDVGDWDAVRVASLLEGGRGSVSDEDAQQVVEMIGSASASTRGGLIRQLEDMGKLDSLCENLPWRQVQRMWDDIEDDPEAARLLGRHWRGKGGGQSMTALYEDKITENIDEGRGRCIPGPLPCAPHMRAYGWTFLKTAHSAATFGFTDVHDPAYDANQQGWISDDAYWSTTAKAAGRSAALMAATAVTGGAAGAWGEGAALGARASQSLAQVVGGAVGGATSGATGQLTADLYDQAFMGADGFSSPSQYLAAIGEGAIGGGATAAMPLASTRSMRQSTAEVYGRRYPELERLLTRIRNHGQHSTEVIVATAQELHVLARATGVPPEQLAESLARIRAVHDARRIVPEEQVFTRIVTASEVERSWGQIDRATGDVTITQENPTVGGFCAVSDGVPSDLRGSDMDVRRLMGIDTRDEWYLRYTVLKDPLYEIVFRTKVELSKPLRQTGTRDGYNVMGGTDPRTHHRPGTGLTYGGLREGVLPPGSPIEIVAIRPVGHRHRPDGYPSPRPLGPAVTHQFRNVPAPLAGGVSPEPRLDSEVPEEDER